MSEPYTIAHESTPDPSAVAHIRASLSAYNRQHAGDDTFTPITLLVRDHNGAVVGGLLGGTYWDWLVVDILWLTDDARHQGIGSQLLQQAEQIAIAGGCHAAHLDTMSFQAPAFYEQHGYSVFGVLDDLPRGHRRYFLQKKLTPLVATQDDLGRVRRAVDQLGERGRPLAQGPLRDPIRAGSTRPATSRSSARAKSSSV